MVNFLLVKDLAQFSGKSVHTVKYYLKIGLIKEIGRSPETNFRYFDYSTLNRLRQICGLRKKNLAIRQIQEILGP